MSTYEIVERDRQPYAAIPVTVSIDQLGSVVPPDHRSGSTT